MKAIGLAFGTLFVGLGLGWFLFSKADPTPPPAAPPAELETAKAEAAEARDQLERTQRSLQEAIGKVAEFEKEGGILRGRVAELGAAAAAPPAPPSADDAAGDAAAAAAGTGSSLRFSFGEYDGTLKEIDWSKVGVNTGAMVPLIQELLDSARNKTPVPGEAIGKVQQHNGALVAVAFQLKDKLPGIGINGSFTHPAFMVNSMAATLEAAGLPLSAEQAEALGQLGRDFTNRDRARTSGYDDSTYMLAKVLDEAEMKDRFFEQALALLTPNQAETLSPPATRGLVSLDLYSSGLMLAQVIRPADGSDRETFLKSLGDGFVSGASFPADRRADLDQVLKTWGADLPDAVFTEETLLLAGVQPIYSVSRVEEVGRKQLALLKRVAEEMGVPEEVAAALRGSGVVMMPLVKAQK